MHAKHRPATRHRFHKASCRFFLLLEILVPASGGTSAATPLCLPVHTRIEASFVAEGCSSPVGLCTAGTITEGGLLNGGTRFTALAAAPAAGMYGVEADSTLSYNGELIVTTRHGVLEISDVGVFDQAAGKFTELDRVIAGTGMFENASGVLFISGDSYADGSGFDGRISGELCLVK